MSNLETKYKLKANPFRMTPATSPDDIVWAGFPDIKAKLDKRILMSLRIPNSSLVLNWGEYGSGKTHAARYFSKNAVLNDISTRASSKLPYSIVMPLPKGKDPVFNIYTNIIDKIDIGQFREKLTESGIDIESVANNITDNMQVQSVLKCVFKAEVEPNALKKYLYGNTNATELKELNKYGILRNFDSDSDYTKFLAGLFTCLTYEKNIYSNIILWVDEFEDIAVLSNSNIDKINNFIREILDNTPNNLLIFINLTQSALIGVEDLGEYVYESVRSRIKERNNFNLPSTSEKIDYLKELISLFRTETHHNPYFPFENDAVDEIIKNLENVSIRGLNEAFSLLLEIAEMEDVCPITKDFFIQYKSEILGWKDQ